MHAQNGALRWIQDRRRHQRAINTTIRYSKGAASHFIRGDFTIARPRTKISNSLFGCGQIHRPGIFNHWHYKALRCTNGNADIIIIFVNDIITVNFSIHSWEFTERLNCCLYKYPHKPQTGVMYRLECLFEISAQCHQRQHVNFIECGQHGRCILG